MGALGTAASLALTLATTSSQYEPDPERLSAVVFADCSLDGRNAATNSFIGLLNFAGHESEVRTWQVHLALERACGSKLNAEEERYAEYALSQLSEVFNRQGSSIQVDSTEDLRPQTLDDYLQSTSNDVSSAPDQVAFLSYASGAILAGIGVINLKQHVENPSNTPLKEPLAKLGFGGLLLALPSLADVAEDQNRKPATFRTFESVEF